MSESSRLQSVQEKVEKIRSDEEIGVKYMLEWEEREEMREEAREEGLAEGRAEGFKQGIEQGKLETARALIGKGIPVETVSECTGLSMKKIKAIKGA